MKNRFLSFPLYGVLALAAARGPDGGAEPPRELKVNDAVLMVDGKPLAPVLRKDTFGPGLDSTVLGIAPKIYCELLYACKDVPEGDYCLGLLQLLPGGYSSVPDAACKFLQLYHNDSRISWTSYTEPLRPENAAEKNGYQAEMRVDMPLHLRTGDIFRVLFAGSNIDAVQYPRRAVDIFRAMCAGSNYVLGPIRLYKERPAGAVDELLVLPDSLDNRFKNNWLYVDWAEPQRTPEKITQRCTLYNPGVLPRTFKLQVQARDYLIAPLMRDSEETLTLEPGRSVTRTCEFKPSITGRDRLTLTAEAEGMWPPVRKVKFYVQDRMHGPRPNACLGAAAWEMCFVAGVEPGAAPPADAAWKKVKVPTAVGLIRIKEIKKEGDKEIRIDHHCMWYRKRFTSPHVQGERVILEFMQLFSEAWFYLNGKPVGHELHGQQPFEVDVTAAYKPGQENELLIAVRDWIAYSPKNQERVRKGEPLLVRQDAIDIVDYSSAENIGIDRPVSLEGRPAVSVDDVFVVTSVREKKLKLKYRLINKTDQSQEVTVIPKILDEGKVVPLFEPKPVVVPANQTAELWFDAPWQNPKYWWRDDPHLYVLETDLKPQTGAADRHWQRFGFRELWIDGYSWIMNGTRVKFKGAYTSSGSFCDFCPHDWEPEKRLEALWNNQVWQVKDLDLQICRTFNAETLDTADEIGLMAKRGGDFNQLFFTTDPQFWKAGVQQALRFMDASKNHPSVVCWEAGNENMWGWIYLGEEVKAFGNQWQVKIAQAMRDFDLMRRPIDWDADGDLFGKWEEHALHYPKDGVTDVPNGAWWGPWDGKTVARAYPFGPIIMGQKPICLGESAWVEPGMPYGETLMLGDRAYLSSQSLWKADVLWTYFFNAGYRDAEFAYLDTTFFLPPLLKPQTIVLKQETASFYGGRTLELDVNIHNDVRHAATLTLRWSLTGKDGAPLADGASETFKLDPAELKRTKVAINLPEVNGPVTATWRVELLDGTRLIHQETREWRIHPAMNLSDRQASGLAVYDPVGDTASALAQMGVKFLRLSDLAKVPGKALLIGKDAFDKTSHGAALKALTAFVRDGGKVVLFAQKQALDFLPTTVQLVTDNRTTIAFVRAADHPVMRGLTDADMRWWADDHYVAKSNWQKPVAGRWLPLVDIGTGDGLTQTPLAEVYDGAGSFVLCQLLVVEKALTAPPAGRLLRNLLDYLAAPACFRSAGRTAVFAGAESPLRKALLDSQLVSEDLTGKIGELRQGKFEIAIVDVATALDEVTAGALRAFAEGGGRVFLHRGTPEKQALLEKLLGVRLRFFPVEKEPQDIQNKVLRLTDCSGILAGVSNHELWWISPDCKYAITERIGYKVPPTERIADYFCWPADDAGDKARRLTRPGALIQFPAGKGCFILNQMRLDQPPPTLLQPVLVARLRNMLLTNLGCELKGDADLAKTRLRHLQQCEFTPVDLSPYTNRGFDDDKDAGIIGWSNQGAYNMADANALKGSTQVLGGVPFRIAAPKSCVVLFSRSGQNKDLPKEVKGIKVGRKADEIFFLHDSCWTKGRVFTYRINYKDGTSTDIGIDAGKQIIDWIVPPERVFDAMQNDGVFMAWKGYSPAFNLGVIIQGLEWRNPCPDKVVRDIDFISAFPGAMEGDYKAVPILIGITTAVTQADEGIVTDVINTRGIKVKLGAQAREVYYIGVGGIDEKHPYFAKAVEAHRTMMVGQRVMLDYDTVRQNNVGQTLAYVYLGDTRNTVNLVNGKILSAGLGALGNFEGNDRLRMFLMNTGEPAKWRKVGMWGEDAK